MKRFGGVAIALAAGSMAATGAAAETLGGPGLTANLPVEASSSAVAAAEMATAVAQDDAPADGDSDLEVSFTPYLWLAGIDGNIGIPRNDNEVEVDRSFGDILGDLKFAFMGTLDVNYRRFVVHTDVIYLSIGADIERADSLIFTEGEFEAKQLIATGAVGYRVIDRGPMFVDLYAGGRLVSLDVDLSLVGPLQTREASASPSNISPLVGAKTRIPLSDRWALALQGDIGFDSDVKWQLAGIVQYQLGHHWRIGLGYRHMALHHDTEEHEIDVALSGPLLAVTYIF